MSQRGFPHKLWIAKTAQLISKKIRLKLSLNNAKARLLGGLCDVIIGRCPLSCLATGSEHSPNYDRAGSPMSTGKEYDFNSEIASRSPPPDRVR